MRTPRIDFIGRSRTWALVSGVLMVFSLGSILIGGLDLSIEFIGGTSYRLEGVRADVTAGELRAAAESEGAQDVIAQLQTEDNRTVGALVRMEAIEPGSDEAVSMREALQQASSAEEVQESFVGPTWGERITRQSLEALLVFLVVIAIYISLRLEWKMAVAAIVALVHDIVFTVGIYAAVGFNISPATIIALLTILGYSLYDTVVVFDRVKDNSATLGDRGRRTYAQLVNSSMNEVVYRSLNTSVTSLLPVGALLLIGSQLLGATTLQDMALALFLGMTVGLYSSLFVAGPLFAWLKSREPEEQRRVAKVAKAEADGEFDEAEGPADVPAPGSPEARAPITTEYVRGQGKGSKRRKKRR